MSNAGQAVLTIVGTVVGYFVGYPQLGFVLGSLAGNALFPTQLPTVRGPKLDDLTVQGSAVGLPVSIVYGAFRVAGNIIWSTDLIATVTTERQGGKGGPSQKTETTSYSVNFAVGLCEGPITGVRRIWAGGKLIYDRRDQLPGESVTTFNNRMAAANSFDTTATLYLGTEDALPDPLIESYEGVGNVPAYRGLAYYIFEDFQLADYGNNLMATALTFEVIVAGSIDFQEITECAPSYIAPWLVDIYNPYSLDNDHQLTAMIHRLDADGSPSVFFSTTAADITMNEALSDLIVMSGVSSPNGNPLAPNWPDFFALSAYTDKNNISSTTNQTIVFDGGLETDGAYRCSVYLFPFSLASVESFHEIGSIAGATFEDKLATLSATVTTGEYCYIEYDGSGVAGHGPPPCALFLNNGGSTIVGVDNVWNWDAGVYSVNPEIYFDGTNYWYTCTPITISGIRIPRAPSQKCNPRTPPIPDPPDAPFPGYCDISGVYYEKNVDWTENLDVSNAKILQTYNTRVDYRDQVEPFLLSTDPNYSNQAYWEAAYAVAEADGTMPSSLTYPTDYPVAGYWDGFSSPAKFYCLTSDQSFISTDLIRLFNIVEDLCRRSGLAVEQYDASPLIQIVDGYAIGRIMDAYGAIMPLRYYGFFDMVESDGILKFVLRGGDISATIDENDLAAHEGGSDRPSAVQVSRAQDIELPRVMRVKYAMRDKDYQPGEQYASRLRTTADQVVDMEIPVSMSDALAIQIADVSLYEAWLNRNSYTFALSQKHMLLEPTDPINIPVDDGLQRVRIISEDFSIPGVKQIRAVRDGPASTTYTSYITGDGASPLVPGGEISLRDPTIALYLDLPMLIDSNNDPGYYVALRQESDDGFWPGASVLRSADGGGTYMVVASATQQSVTGFVTSIDSAGGVINFNFLPPGDVEIVNYGIELTVDLDLTNMLIVSTTIDGLLAGANAAAVGLDGRWEIIQFLNAENISTSSENVWKLTGLARGRRGTDYVMNQELGLPGDRFVMLNNLVRANQELASIGAARLMKAVTSGQDVAAVSPVSFTGNGEALEPVMLVTLEGTRDGGDNLTITWVRRSRFGQELPSGADIPLGETTEAYEVDIYDGSDVVRTISVTSQTASYTAAEQTTDFGSPQGSIDVKVYQMSETVGRGHPAERTL